MASLITKPTTFKKLIKWAWELEAHATRGVDNDILTTPCQEYNFEAVPPLGRGFRSIVGSSIEGNASCISKGRVTNALLNLDSSKVEPGYSRALEAIILHGRLCPHHDGFGSKYWHVPTIELFTLFDKEGWKFSLQATFTEGGLFEGEFPPPDAPDQFQLKKVLAPFSTMKGIPKRRASEC